MNEFEAAAAGNSLTIADASNLLYFAFCSGVNAENSWRSIIDIGAPTDGV